MFLVGLLIGFVLGMVVMGFVMHDVVDGEEPAETGYEATGDSTPTHGTAVYGAHGDRTELRSDGHWYRDGKRMLAP